MGDICGRFLGYDHGSSLSSVHIKIKLRGLIPTEIPLSYGEEVFPLVVERDELILPAFAGGVTALKRRLIQKGKEKVDHKLSDTMEASSSGEKILDTLPAWFLDVDSLATVEEGAQVGASNSVIESAEAA
ncbi:hypothetical protein LINPERHAP2_LOCUS5177 [Linum perenne]